MKVPRSTPQQQPAARIYTKNVKRPLGVVLVSCFLLYPSVTGFLNTLKHAELVTSHPLMGTLTTATLLVAVYAALGLWRANKYAREVAIALIATSMLWPILSSLNGVSLVPVLAVIFYCGLIYYLNRANVKAYFGLSESESANSVKRTVTFAIILLALTLIQVRVAQSVLQNEAVSAMQKIRESLGR